MYREGYTYNTEAIKVYDHDWPTLAEGIAVPHGLYDITQNIGYVQIGTSRDTSEFACDSIYYWWTKHGRSAYAEATSILLLCDGGGSNGSRFYIFKQDLQQLANDLGIEIRIAHYPPYTSKYNPIEHRLFPHLSRVCQGVIFDSVERVQELMAKASTLTGLKVFTTIIDAVYETGRQATDAFKQQMPIIFDDDLPNWNYVARPQQL
ncbi:MAG: ISAzo13 family transposase [Phormidesmis sp.]